MIPNKQSVWSVTARWVFPVDRPPLEAAIITVSGDRIVAVEERGSRTPDIDFGDSALLPGLVNAHVHLDLSGLKGKIRKAPSFLDWLRAVIQHRRSLTAEQVAADIRAGIEECLASGTTLVGDIAGQGLSWPLLAESSLRAVVYYEVLGLPKARAKQVWSEARAWLTAHPATGSCRPGLSPHAPYSVRRSLIRCAALASVRERVPLAIHIDETREEKELISTRKGPMISFLTELGAWDETGLVQEWELLHLLRAVDPLSVAHGNYLEPENFHSNGSVVYCPRTHAYFGHPAHPVMELLTRGVNVALGTDSLGSNPDLDMLAEMRFLNQRRPDLPADVILRLATLNGAKALGWDDDAGSLDSGKSADFAVVPIRAVHGDPYQSVFESDEPVSAVLCRGELIWPRQELECRL